MYPIDESSPVPSSNLIEAHSGIKHNPAKALLCANSVGTEVLAAPTKCQCRMKLLNIISQSNNPCIAFPMSRRVPGFLPSFSLMRLIRTL